MLLIVGLAMPAWLGVSYLIGAAAARALRGRVRLRPATLTVTSMLGISLGFVALGSLQPGTLPWQPPALGVAFLSSLAAIAVVTGVVARRQLREAPRPLAELLAGGESHALEFKSTARWNLHKSARDPQVELVIAKTLAGFMNAEGGTLLIGVADDGSPLGLDADRRIMKFADNDRYELWLRDFLSATLGQNAARLPGVTFEEQADADGVPRTVCRVICPASPRPVYLRQAKSQVAEFWVRVGNSTRLLHVDEATDYVMHRWPLSLGSTVAAQARAAMRFSR